MVSYNSERSVMLVPMYCEKEELWLNKQHCCTGRPQFEHRCCVLMTEMAICIQKRTLYNKPYPLTLTIFQPLLPKCPLAFRMDNTDIQFGVED